MKRGLENPYSHQDPTCLLDEEKTTIPEEVADNAYKPEQTIRAVTKHPTGRKLEPKDYPLCPMCEHMSKLVQWSRDYHSRHTRLYFGCPGVKCFPDRQWFMFKDFPLDILLPEIIPHINAGVGV